MPRCLQWLFLPVVLVVALFSFSFAAGKEDYSFLDAGFVRLDLLIPDVIQDIRYAGENNFAGARIDGYEAPVALLSRQAAEALRKAADDFRSRGYRIVIFDAYRPESAVEHFIRWVMDDSDTSTQATYYPTLSKRALLSLGYISMSSSHSRGSAVDLTLADAAGDPIDMGGGFDLFSPLSAHGAKSLTPEQAANRELLRSIMAKNGFNAYQNEWWHYTLRKEPFPNQRFRFPITDRIQFLDIPRSPFKNAPGTAN